MALEPYLRRRWPQILISWARLLAGDFRDRLVAGHILIGAAFGVATSLIIDFGNLTGWRMIGMLSTNSVRIAMLGGSGFAAVLLSEVVEATALVLGFPFCCS